MVQNLLQKWYKLGSKIMNNAIPSGSELFRVFLMEKWVVRASGAHHLPHAARKRLVLFLASSIWGCGHETMARASRKKFLWKELFFKATGRLRPAFKKSSFPWNIERIKNVLKCTERFGKLVKSIATACWEHCAPLFAPLDAKRFCFRSIFIKKWSGHLQKWGPENVKNVHQKITKMVTKHCQNRVPKIHQGGAKTSPKW